MSANLFYDHLPFFSVPAGSCSLPMTTGARFRPALSSSGYAGVSFPPVRGQQRCLCISFSHFHSVCFLYLRHSALSPLSTDPLRLLSEVFLGRTHIFLHLFAYVF